MPAKRDAATELAEKMLRSLETQRDLGANAYPSTLRRLAELADPNADTQTIQKAVKKKAFSDRAVVIQAKNLECPVTLSEDADQLAASPGLLEYLLETLCTAANPTIEVSKLKKKAPAAVKEVFGTALDRRISENALPLGVVVIAVKNKPHLHLQRYPLPRKPEEVLAEELVKVLHAQRQLGEGAYPTRLARLIELTRPAADDALIKKTMTQATFQGTVVLALKNEPETPVALTGDLQLLADCPSLLVMALRRARSETHQACSPKDLKAKVVPLMQKAFEASIIRRAEEGKLPPGVGRLLQKKQPLFFLVSDIVSGSGEERERERCSPVRPAPVAPHSINDNREASVVDHRAEPARTTATAESVLEFAHAFEEVFRRLDEQSRSHNFVSLLELRRGLPFDRQAFDAGLHELRRSGRYTLSAAEGRDGVRPEEQEAGIIEDGSLLLFVSRKVS